MLSKSKPQSNEPIFFLAWRLEEQVTRSGNDTQVHKCDSYTELVVREAHCFELLLLIILCTLAAMSLTLDLQACQVRNGTGDQGLKSHIEAIQNSMQGLRELHSQIRILDKV